MYDFYLEYIGAKCTPADQDLCASLCAFVGFIMSFIPEPFDMLEGVFFLKSRKEFWAPTKYGTPFGGHLLYTIFVRPSLGSHTND